MFPMGSSVWGGMNYNLQLCVRPCKALEFWRSPAAVGRVSW